LLKDFDILKQPSDGTMVVSDHVKLTAHDVLELYFTPVTNTRPSTLSKWNLSPKPLATERAAGKKTA
jgi:hypothetical protein